jgi:hypothetical protein
MDELDQGVMDTINLLTASATGGKCHSYSDLSSQPSLYDLPFVSSTSLISLSVEPSALSSSLLNDNKILLLSFQPLFGFQRFR